MSGWRYDYEKIGGRLRAARHLFPAAGVQVVMKEEYIW